MGLIKPLQDTKEWELLQSEIITGTEIDVLKFNFPEGYSEFVITIERTSPSQDHMNTMKNELFIYANLTDENNINVIPHVPYTEWKHNIGNGFCYTSFTFSTMNISENNVFKVDNIVRTVDYESKAQQYSSGWVMSEGGIRWKDVQFSIVLNVGSKYNFWGLKK